jgi:DNA polymerase V
VQKNRFDARVPPPYSRSATITLPSGPSADTLVLARYAERLLNRLWEPGTVYHKAGVVLDGLEPPSSGQQLGLFEAATAPATTPAELLADRMPLMNTLDNLNQRFGRGTVRLASAIPALATMVGHQRPPWQGQAKWQSPAFTTRLEDLMTVK